MDHDCLIEKQDYFPGGPVLGIHLAMQGIWVCSWLGSDDPTCHGATKPHATTIEPMLPNPRARVL